MSKSLVVFFALLVTFRTLPAEAPGGFSFDAPRSVLPADGGLLYDFNNDGIPDLAALSSTPPYATSAVNIFLGDGHGTFQSPVSYPVGLGACCFVIGDFNGDGAADIVAINGGSANSPPGFSILLGNGNGTFKPSTFVTLGGEYPTSIAAADLNGDGNLDLAMTSNTGVLVLLGNGHGGFAAPVSYETAGVYASSVIVVDFNLDGIPDLAVANGGEDHSGADVAVLLGKGDGTFGSAIATLAGYSPEQLIAADFNGDGKPDLAVGAFGLDDNGTVTILLGNGDGTFQPPTYYSVGRFLGLAGGDVNHDGHIDLVVCNYNVTTILLGTGEGTFTEGKTFQPTGVPTLVDFNSDGNLDIELGSAILFGNGQGDFERDVTYPAGNQSVAVALGDFNGDGIPDAAVSISRDSTHVTAILLGKGDGSFSPPQNFRSAEDPDFIAIGDFNNDGKLDLAVADAAYQANRVIILLGNGDGTFQTGRPFSTGGSPGVIVIADFNGDGIPDLAVSNLTSTGQVAVLFGNGDGTFQTAIQYAVGTGFGIATADFNGDGKPDLAIVGTSVVSVLLDQGSGTFGQQVDYPVGLNPVAVAAADLNGDGRPDLAVANNASSTVSILINDASGFFLSAATYPANRGPSALAIADFNNDGVPDLAVSCTGDSTISFLAGIGEGVFAKPVSFEIGNSLGSVAAADLNGDGKPDVVSPSGLTAIGVLLNESPR
jgi:hypothetical protein